MTRAGTDIGPRDTVPRDTDPQDARPVDGGPVDAGPVDNGPVDDSPDEVAEAAGPQAKVSAGALLHQAARIEDAVHDFLEPRARRRGWGLRITPFTGYGARGWARVMCRVLLSRTSLRPEQESLVRGWRSFTSLPVSGAEVMIEAGGRMYTAQTDRGGYVDTVVEVDLPSGFADVRLRCEGARDTSVRIRVVDPAVRFGIISDVDDTIMVTALPRPFLAAWNTFVLAEYARTPVPGMAVLYERLVNAHPGAPVLYLSTGAWNVAPALTRFLSRQLYPAGPLLLTDWGPSTDRWFRSGQEHKRQTLARLARELPDVEWLLIGDDGQHDPSIYEDFARAHPDNVAGVAIRHLSPAQSMLAHGLPAPAADAHRSLRAGSLHTGQRWVSAPDGSGLSMLLKGADLL